MDMIIYVDTHRALQRAIGTYRHVGLPTVRFKTFCLVQVYMVTYIKTRGYTCEDTHTHTHTHTYIYIYIYI